MSIDPEGIADDPLGTAHALPTNTAAPDARPHQSQPELENTDASRRSGQEFHESAESASLGHQSSNSFAPLIEDGKDVADEQTSTVSQRPSAIGSDPAAPFQSNLTTCLVHTACREFENHSITYVRSKQSVNAIACPVHLSPHNITSVSGLIQHVSLSCLRLLQVPRRACENSCSGLSLVLPTEQI